MSRTIKDMPWRVRWAEKTGRRLSSTWRDDFKSPRWRDYPHDRDEYRALYDVWHDENRRAWDSVNHSYRDHCRRKAGSAWEERRITEHQFRAMTRAAIVAGEYDEAPTMKNWRRMGWWWD